MKSPRTDRLLTSIWSDGARRHRARCAEGPRSGPQHPLRQAKANGRREPAGMESLPWPTYQPAHAGRSPITIVSLAVTVLVFLTSPAHAAKVSFSRDIVPILSTSCFPCHGPDANKRKADLRLDLRDSALSERDGQPAIVPGQPNQRELVARITRKDAAHRMPP